MRPNPSRSDSDIPRIIPITACFAPTCPTATDLALSRRRRGGSTDSRSCQKCPRSLSLGNLMDRLGKALYVRGRDACNRYPAVFGCIYGVLIWPSVEFPHTCSTETNLLGELLHLLGVQASVGEHPNLDSQLCTMTTPRKSLYLRSNMAPIMFAAESFEVFLQQRPHPNDAVCHFLDFSKPLLIQGRVVEDFRGNPSTVYGRVRIQWPDKDFDL